MTIANHNISLADFTWDGMDNSGKAIPSGNYKVTAEANIHGQNTE